MSRGFVASERAFEHGWTIFERIVFGIAVIFLAAGATGLLGGGWLSRSAADIPQAGAKVEFDWVLRNMGVSRMIVTFPVVSQPREVAVFLGDDFLAHFTITGTSPEAISMTSGGQGVTYMFQLATGGGANLVFDLKPRQIGAFNGSLSVDGISVPLTQIVLP